MYENIFQTPFQFLIRGSGIYLDFIKELISLADFSSYRPMIIWYRFAFVVLATLWLFTFLVSVSPSAGSGEKPMLSENASY